MLRRRRREGGDRPASEPGAAGPGAEPYELDVSDSEDYQDAASVGTAGGGHNDGPAGQRTGPWDIASDYPAVDRIDCGSLLIPVNEGFDVQINVAEEQGVWVAVVHDDSGMQLQAFAAPRSGGLWDDVRQEIAENIAGSGGSCREEPGPFGTELRAQVPMGDEGQPGELQSVRFLGFDGPRWFLRGVISGPAASQRQQGAPFDALFADIVVVRGDYPAPPREQLEIRLPEEARQAIEAQLAQEGDDWVLPNPFERGPEITEIR